MGYPGNPPNDTIYVKSAGLWVPRVIGAANGVAALDGTGKVPVAQLPSLISPRVIVRHLSTANSPLALWKLDGNLLDTSGNSRTLALLTGTGGTLRYTDVAPSVRGLRLDGATALVITDAALRLVGDMTFEAVMTLDLTGTAMGILACTAPGETLADNYLYGIFTGATGGLDYLSESGAGVDAAYHIDDSLPIGCAFHYAFVRASNTITHYLNGVQLGATSGVVTASATNGSATQKVYLGVNMSSGFVRGSMASAKMLGSALTSAQVLAEYNSLLG